MSQKENEDPRLRHVQVINTLKEAIIGLLEYVPELKSVGIVLDWNVGRSEYPFGMMIGREGVVRKIDELFTLMQQTSKLCHHQAKVMTDILVNIDGAAHELSKKSRALMEEVKELEAKKEALLKERNSDEQK